MATEKEKMLSGQLYSATDKTLSRERARAKRLLYQLNVSEFQVTERVKLILRELLPNAGENLYIEPPFYCDYGYNIHCGENVFFNVNCVVLDVVKVNIGSNVFFGPGVHIYTASHPTDHIQRRTVEYGERVSIGNDCWIGGGAIILPGVHIGNRCIIGAGAVVTRNIPDDSLALGSPAKVVKKILPND